MFVITKTIFRDRVYLKSCYISETSRNKKICLDADMATPGTAYLQIDLFQARQVAGITTQGRPQDAVEYVSQYKVSYSSDGNSFTFVTSGGSGVQYY